ncbi:MAG: hypothetical protein R3320_14415 [Nitriliruptorales bacterium]|nr:hypothetical protein [Nitriliruptorales bacterium]
MTAYLGAPSPTSQPGSTQPKGYWIVVDGRRSPVRLDRPAASAAKSFLTGQGHEVQLVLVHSASETYSPEDDINEPTDELCR